MTGMKRSIRGALLFLIFAMAFALAVPALGAEATYQMTAQYMASKYYDNFCKVPLSGDQATDVIAIALSQLGYHEGDSNADLGGMNTKGSKDFVGNIWPLCSVIKRGLFASGVTDFFGFTPGFLPV